MSRWGDPIERFFSKVVIDPAGCHLWIGQTSSNGYGKLYWKGGKKLAHRVSLEIHLGEPISTELLVRHSCDIRLCVNPAHLLTGTHAENTQDMMSRGRYVCWNRGTAKLDCPKHNVPKIVYPLRKSGRIERYQYYCAECRRDRRMREMDCQLADSS